MPHLRPAGDRWREDGKKKMETNGAFVTLTEGNSGKIFKNRLEMKRKRRKRAMKETEKLSQVLLEATHECSQVHSALRVYIK